MLVRNVKIEWVLISCCWILAGTQARAGKYAAEFLRIGIGARALAMGGAFVAIAEDGTAGYWNPAGLVQINRWQINLSHVRMFNNLAQHNFASFSLRVTDNSALAVSWIRLAIDDIPKYSALEGTRFDRIANPHLRSTGIPEGFFNDVEDALLFSFGRSFEFELTFGGGLMPLTLPSRLCIGVSYKFISEKLYQSKGTGQGLDIGLLYRVEGSTLKKGLPRRSFSLGVNFQDVSRTVIVWNTSTRHRDKLPLNVLWGTAYSQWLPWLDSQIILALDREQSYGSVTHWGGEWVFKRVLSLRAGFQDNEFTAGAGLKIFRLRVDYAFVSYELGNTHRISGAVEF